MTVKTIKKYIKKYRLDGNTKFERDVLRSFVTTYCYEKDINVDTGAWTLLINDLYDAVKEQGLKMSLNKFDMEMCHFLV